MCNRRCKYCFGPQNENSFLSYEVIKKIIDNMLIFKIKNLSITGGEPFMHPDIELILKYAKEKKLNISVSTNTDFIKKEIHLLKYVDILGIPIDSHRYEKHDEVRGNGSLYNVINTLEYIENNCQINVRIGTVLNQINEYEIYNIADILKNYKCVKVWRIYDELKYGYKRLNQNSLSDCRKFKIKLEKITHILSSKEVTYIERKNRNLGYFIIEPDGNVFMPMISEMRDIKQYIGNIHDDSFEKLIKIWEPICDIKNHVDMVENIFKGEGNG